MVRYRCVSVCEQNKIEKKKNHKEPQIRIF